MVQKVCENPRCLAVFEIGEKYASRKRFCTTACGARAASARAWARDPEGRKAAQRVWRANNPEKHKQNAARWYEQNRDRMVAGMRERYYKEKEMNAEALALENRLRYERLRKHQPWRKLLMNARARAKKRDLPFDLTMEWIEAKWTGYCEFTGVQFDVLGSKLYAPSIDRIRPKEGYIQANCRLILWGVNMLKAEFTDEDVIVIAKLIVCSQKP